jgi:hypothetical protein
MFARDASAYFDCDFQRSAQGCRSAGVSPAIFLIGMQHKNAGETPALRDQANLPT